MKDEIDITTIAVKKKTWRRLNSIRGCGESMDNVINRLLDMYNSDIASEEQDEN